MARLSKEQEYRLLIEIDDVLSKYSDYSISRENHITEILNKKIKNDNKEIKQYIKDCKNKQNMI